MRLGGVVPLGYDLQNREMVVNAVEARQVNHIFERYLALKCVAKLKAELDRDGWRSKVRVSKKGVGSGGHSFTRGALYRILQNRIYLGKIVHNGTAYPGNHLPIVAQSLWDEVRQNLLANRTTFKLQSRAKDPSLLSGLVFDERGNAFSPTHAVKNGKRYRYYVNQALIQFRPEDAGAVRRIAAHEVEQLLCNKLQQLLSDPTQLADLLEVPHDDRETLAALQAGAGQLALAWENLASTDCKILVQRVVTRMVILSNRVDLLISWQGLADAVGVSIARNGQADTFTLSLDAQFRRIGGETKLVLQGSVADPPPSQSDPVLLNALAQAHAWGELYRRDPTLPMAYFAARARVSESYATRILRLAYLAPDIVEAIIAGKQPRSLTLKRLLRGIPLSWSEQRERFGLRQA